MARSGDRAIRQVGKRPNGVAALKTLKAVYDFMIQNGLEALEIVADGAQVKLVRRRAAPASVGRRLTEPYAASPYGSVAAGTAPVPAGMAPVPAGTAIKSPMMGVFYRAPSPSSPPFCKEGEQVKAGHVTCMIEAMKVFNEIKAEYPCTIVKYLVENGKPVKSGQDLIIVAR